jgi:hypothetical protein
MRHLFISVCGLLSVCACHQQKPVVVTDPVVDVTACVDLLMQGIREADEVLLRDLTAEELVYGHSSGKVQDKEEFVAEIISGKPLVYVSISLTEQMVKVVGETAIVRHVFSAETLTEGAPGTLRIGNVLIWQLQEGRWKLLARQAFR